MLGKEKVLFQGYQIYLMHQPNPSRKRGLQLAPVLPPTRIGSLALKFFIATVSLCFLQVLSSVFLNVTMYMMAPSCKQLKLKLVQLKECVYFFRSCSSNV